MVVIDPHPVFFPEAVASVLNQSFADFELVIVEDPSSASAAALLERFDDPRIRHMRNAKRAGLVAQRNRTLSRARGGLVALLDADDVMEPERLTEQIAFMRSNPEVSLVGSQLRIIDDTGAERGFRAYPTSHAEILRAMPRYNAVPQPGVMARKHALTRSGGYRFEFPVEDYDLWSRMLKDGAVFANHGAPLTRYRIHSGASKGHRLRDTIRLTSVVKQKYWREQMSLGDRIRYGSERALVLCPTALVSWLFRTLHYRRRGPAQAVPRPHR